MEHGHQEPARKSRILGTKIKMSNVAGFGYVDETRTAALQMVKNEKKKGKKKKGHAPDSEYS